MKNVITVLLISFFIFGISGFFYYIGHLDGESAKKKTDDENRGNFFCTMRSSDGVITDCSKNSATITTIIQYKYKDEKMTPEELREAIRKLVEDNGSKAVVAISSPPNSTIISWINTNEGHAIDMLNSARKTLLEKFNEAQGK